jgi:Kef-type K+ transport system membrane component KefB
MNAPGTLLLVQAVILIAGPWMLWRLTGIARIAPLAVLQILFGVLLGPSVLGRALPEVQAALFPADSILRIGAVAQLAVVFYSFVTGMHLDTAVVRGTRRIGAIALGSFIAPLLVGLALALPLAELWPQTLPPSGHVGGYMAAIALLLAVTALPVLAALLKEMGLLQTPFGQRALALSALNDSGMWLCVAAILLLTAPAGGEGAGIFWLPVYGLVVLAAATGLKRLTRDGPGNAALILAAAFAPLSAAAAEFVGLGYVIGAFVAGLIVPPAARAALRDRIEWPALYLLMPFFFMATGLRVKADLLSGEILGLVAVLTVAAVLSKIAGAALAARYAGLGWREGTAIGVALQTKGLMEVLVATILVDHGVIGEALFAPLILMALICTTLTAPLLRALGLREDGELSPGGAPRTTPPPPAARAAGG